jgi:hypothetical protein
MGLCQLTAPVGASLPAILYLATPPQPACWLEEAAGGSLHFRCRPSY